jgi:hypothetical protein
VSKTVLPPVRFRPSSPKPTREVPRIILWFQLASLAAAGYVFSGCSLAGSGSETDGSETRGVVPTVSSVTETARPTCGRPSLLKREESIESEPAARVGPLLFVLGGGPRAETAYLRGYPTKELLHLTEGVESPLSLQGWRCPDEKPLRFWYREGPPFAEVPVPRNALETTGDLIARLEPHDRSIDYTGYMLFTSTGIWDIAVLSEGRVTGHVVIKVIAGLTN